MRIAMAHSTIRGDEKLLIQEARQKNIDLVTVDVRKEVFDPATYGEKFDVVLERCVSTTLGMYTISFFENLGVPVINPASVANICVDKFQTSLVLQSKGVPTVPFAMAFGEDEAAEVVERLGGYPVVIKPALGSWGRLLAKINDRDALEAVLEQKSVLGSPSHKAFYIQKFVEKGGRDIRVTVVGAKCVAAIYRNSSHWISNTARGAEAVNCEIDDAMVQICSQVVSAVGEGVLGIDLFETNEGYTVNEVNHTTEFKNVQRVTGVNIAGEILEYTKGLVQK